jgi:hypothetical protein
MFSIVSDSAYGSDSGESAMPSHENRKEVFKIDVSTVDDDNRVDQNEIGRPLGSANVAVRFDSLPLREQQFCGLAAHHLSEAKVHDGGNHRFSTMSHEDEASLFEHVQSELLTSKHRKAGRLSQSNHPCKTNRRISVGYESDTDSDVEGSRIIWGGGIHKLMY